MNMIQIYIGLAIEESMCLAIHTCSHEMAVLRKQLAQPLKQIFTSFRQINFFDALLIM